MTGCRRTPQTTENVAPPSATPSAATLNESVPITLPVLDALFSDQGFRAELQSKLGLSESQVAELKRISSEEVTSLRKSDAEQQPGSAEEARQRAITAIRAIAGDKTDALLALAREHWIHGAEETEAKQPEITMLPGPNAVPPDTRIVVNAPAFRMDMFRNGSLVKSYKVGIGYPQFPLPTGLRKAQTIIFNPTWTPPDSPWVKQMQSVSAGETIEAGSALNPLGPIKIPIGLPSLIHGGKALAKIGTFASHGCVGLTNGQVKDFARQLLTISDTQVSDATIRKYLSNKTKTRAVKLANSVPVELRYETIVVEDGAIHIYRDVYDQNTNTEANLRAVLEKNGIKFEDLSDDERTQVLEALNAFSRKPKKQLAGQSNNANNTSLNNNKSAKNDNSKRGPSLKNRKEILIDIAELKGKGYPPPVDLDAGTGKPAARN